MQNVTAVAAKRLALGIGERCRIDGVFDRVGAETDNGDDGPAQIIGAIGPDISQSWMRHPALGTPIFATLAFDLSYGGRPGFGQGALNLRRCLVEREGLARLDSNTPHLVEDRVVVRVRRVEVGELGEE